MKKEEIKKIIDNKEVVSFDIFDTLLFRNIYKPTDIFKIMEKEISEEYGVENFHDLRISAEAESRNEKNKGESSLDEIYAVVENKIGKDATKIKNRELELELEFICANPFMKEIFDYAVKKKKKIILISDMYLPSSVIEQLLKKAGYKKVPIYMSNEYRANKGTKKIYQVVFEKEKIKKDSWVHIGDNKHCDYKMPKEFGIDAILYENIRSKDEQKEPETIEASIIRGIQNNYLYNGNELSYWERFGVLYASPIYYGFTNWLFRLTQKRDNLYFLARDGYIVKKVYDEFKNKYGTKIDTYYLYGSRKTIYLPALLHRTKDEMLNTLVVLTNDYDVKTTIEHILKSMGLDCEDYQEELSIFGFTKDSVLDKNNFHQVRKFVKHIYDDIEKKLEEQEKIVLEYLKQEGVCNYNKINIMDVGWGGSLQEALGILTGKKIMGYYFGTIPTNKEDILSNSLGFVFDEAKPEKNFMRVFNIPMMYEFIFSAPHGTTLGFIKKDKKIVPVLDEDDEKYTQKVEILQNAAMQVVKTYLVYAEYLKNISVEDSLRAYAEMIERRDFADLIEFSNLTNSVLYTNHKDKYIEKFDEDYIYNHYDEFKNKIHKAMWRDAFLVNGVESEAEWNDFGRRFENFMTRKRITSSNKISYVKKGIKNPKKAARMVKSLMKEKLNNK